MRPLNFIMLLNIIVTFALLNQIILSCFFGHDKAIKIAFANKSVKFFEIFLNHIIIHYPYTIVHKVNGSIVPK